MVIAPARTGRDNRRRITVRNTAQVNRGIRSILSPFVRMFKIVEIKLTAPRMEDAPARCSEKIAMSTDGPACAIFLASGG